MNMITQPPVETATVSQPASPVENPAVQTRSLREQYAEAADFLTTHLIKPRKAGFLGNEQAALILFGQFMHQTAKVNPQTAQLTKFELFMKNLEALQPPTYKALSVGVVQAARDMAKKVPIPSSP